MKEIKKIIEAYYDIKKENQKCALATVVHVEGSSYRRPSARMLVKEDGTMVGAISGGCLEGDALLKAMYAISQNKNIIVTYDTSDEEDAIVGAQLGCNGIIQVLFEPIDYNNPLNPIIILEKIAYNKEIKVLLIHFDLKNKIDKDHLGTSLLVSNENVVTGIFSKNFYTNQLLKDIEKTFLQKKSMYVEYNNEKANHNFYIEYFAPSIKIVIVGAGNDAIPLSEIAEILGWEIIILDGRSTHAKQERFVPSCQVMVSKPEDVLKNILINEKTVFVLMTHNYNYDLSLLKSLIKQEKIPYIGILGPLKKYERMLSDLENGNIELSIIQKEKIFTPVGLEIGAETPEEIALSIVAEIQSVLTGSPATSLRQKTEPIHSREDTQFKNYKL